jgi:hypothetical protein
MDPNPARTRIRMIKLEIPMGLEGDLLRILNGHCGKARKIGGAALLAQVRLSGVKVSERVFRYAIHELRRDGYLICSMPGDDGGYWLACSLDEFTEFIEREIHPKAMDLLETEKVMRSAARQQFGEAVQIQLI